MLNIGVLAFQLVLLIAQHRVVMQLQLLSVKTVLVQVCTAVQVKKNIDNGAGRM